VNISHCQLHTEKFDSTRLAGGDASCKEMVIQVVRFTMKVYLDKGIFNQMWADIGSDKRHFVYHSDVSGQWRGNAFQRAVTVRNDVKPKCLQTSIPQDIKAAESQVDVKESYLSDPIAEISKFNNSMFGSYYRERMS